MPESNNPNSSDDGQRSPKPGMRMSRGIFGWVVVVSFILMLLMLLQQSMNQKVPMTVSDFNLKLELGEIEKVTLRDFTVEGELKGSISGQTTGEPLRFVVQWPAPMENEHLLASLKKYDTDF